MIIDWTGAIANWQLVPGLFPTPLEVLGLTLTPSPGACPTTGWAGGTGGVTGGGTCTPGNGWAGS